MEARKPSSSWQLGLSGATIIAVLVALCVVPTTALGWRYLVTLVTIVVTGCAVYVVLTLGRPWWNPGPILLISCCLAPPVLALGALFGEVGIYSVIIASTAISVIGLARVRPLGFSLNTGYPRPGWSLAVLTAAILSVTAWTGINHGLIEGTPLSLEFLSPDVPLLGALASSMVDGRGLDSPFLTGSTLRYHWLAYGFAGAIGRLAELDFLVVVALVSPLLFLFLSLLVAAAVAGQISRSPWAPMLGASALGLVGNVGVWRFAQSSPWEWGSTSTLMGGLLGLSTCLMLFSDARRHSWKVPLLLGVMACAAVVAKVSVGVLLAIGSFSLLAIAMMPGKRSLKIAGTRHAAVVLGVGLGYVLAIQGSGNELAIAPFLSSDLGSLWTDRFGLVGTELAFIAAPAFLWGGLALVILTRRSTVSSAVIWALIVGLAGQLIFLVLEAPDANDRYFAIAGMTLSTPILSTLLLSLPWCRRSNRKAFLALAPLLLITSSIFLGKAAWSSFFELRPTFFLATAVLLGVPFALLLAHQLNGRSSIQSFGLGIGTYLMLLAILFPQALRLADSQRLTSSAGISPIHGERLVTDWVDLLPMARSLASIKELIPAKSVVALRARPGIPLVFLRWSLYSTGAYFYVSPEADLERLHSSDAAGQTQIRLDQVERALSGDAREVNQLCEEGVHYVIDVGVSEAQHSSEIQRLASDAEISLLRLPCFVLE